MRIRIFIALGIVSIAAGLILGTAVDPDWYFRLVGLGVGILLGVAIKIRRERSSRSDR